MIFDVSDSRGARTVVQYSEETPDYTFPNCFPSSTKNRKGGLSGPLLWAHPIMSAENDPRREKKKRRPRKGQYLASFFFPSLLEEGGRRDRRKEEVIYSNFFSLRHPRRQKCPLGAKEWGMGRLGLVGK